MRKSTHRESEGVSLRERAEMANRTGFEGDD